MEVGLVLTDANATLLVNGGRVATESILSVVAHKNTSSVWVLCILDTRVLSVHL